ncbi:MAG: hypothetical protein KatS3mg057_0136 [Herpetosiphonaceae bacterium]|nr:MAG: hypothetical protein KatS3mg057_0136 [Herpetosiphonaceae bacterium]
MSDNAPASSGALADQASEQPASAPPGRAAEQPALVTLLLAALALLLLLLLATPPTQIVVAWMLPLAVVASLALPRLQQLVDQGHGRQLTRAALTYGTLALAVLYAAQATELVNDRPSSGEEPFINVQSKQREDQGPGEEPSAVLEPATITTPQPAYPIPAADLVTPQPHADAPVSVVTAQPTAFHSTFLPLIGVIVEPPPSGSRSSPNRESRASSLLAYLNAALISAPRRPRRTPTSCTISSPATASILPLRSLSLLTSRNMATMVSPKIRIPRTGATSGAQWIPTESQASRRPETDGMCATPHGRMGSEIGVS